MFWWRIFIFISHEFPVPCVIKGTFSFDLVRRYFYVLKDDLKLIQASSFIYLAKNYTYSTDPSVLMKLLARLFHVTNWTGYAWCYISSSCTTYSYLYQHSTKVRCYHFSKLKYDKLRIFNNLAVLLGLKISKLDITRNRRKMSHPILDNRKQPFPR